MGEFKKQPQHYEVEKLVQVEYKYDSFSYLKNSHPLSYVTLLTVFRYGFFTLIIELNVMLVFLSRFLIIILRAKSINYKC